MFFRQPRIVFLLSLFLKISIYLYHKNLMNLSTAEQNRMMANLQLKKN